jgi:homoaconitate hydratase
VDLVGKPDLGVVGKDVIIALCGLFNQDDVLNAAIEFGGDGVRHLTVDDRLAIANMTTEWGALAGVFPVDDLTAAWLKRMARRQEALHGKPHPRINLDRISAITDSPIGADNGAVYTKRLTLDLSTMRDHYVSGPDAVKVATPISVLAPKRIAVDKAYLVSCTNSRLSDLKQAADVFTRHANENGQSAKVAPGVELYVSAASALVQQDAEDTGVWKTLTDAGAKPLPPGCGPCIGVKTIFNDAINERQDSEQAYWRTGKLEYLRRIATLKDAWDPAMPKCIYHRHVRNYSTGRSFTF